MKKLILLGIIILFCISIVNAGTNYCVDSAVQGYWKFDETTGTTAYDNTSNGNDLVIVGPSINQSCKVNNCYRYDGNNDYLYRSAGAITGLNGVTGITICAWANLDTLGTGNSDDSCIVSTSSGASPISNLLWYNYDAPVAYSYISATSSSPRVNGAPNSAKALEWQFVCGVRNFTTTYIYMNGIKNGTGTATTPSPTGNQFRVGMWQLSSNFWYDGLLDELIVFNRSLSDAEILELYTQTNGGTNNYCDAFGNTAPNQTINSPANGTSTSSSQILWDVTCTDSEGDNTTWFLEKNGSIIYNETSIVGSPFNVSYNASLDIGNNTFTSWCNDGSLNSTIETTLITRTDIYDEFSCYNHPLPFCTHSWGGIVSQCYACGSLRHPMACFGVNSCNANNWSIKYG